MASFVAIYFWRAHVENFETGDIQHTGERLTLLLSVQGIVTFPDEELEQPVKDGLGHGTNLVVTL